ncbi:MAG: histidine kinase dimerization/phospho-acceptor domain-containing protein, partial [Chloroflexota bacterium]
MAQSQPAVVHTHLPERQATSVAALQERYRELLRANAALQRRNEELDAFAHTVAHNLKNPLSIISGQASLLIKFCATLPAEKRQKMLETLANNAMRLTNVIDELLLLAGVGNMEVTLTPLDMALVVAQAERRLAYV